MRKVCYRSIRHDWGTAAGFFWLLDREFTVILDAAATTAAARCPHDFAPADNGLAQDWGRERVILHPS